MFSLSLSAFLSTKAPTFSHHVDALELNTVTGGAARRPRQAGPPAAAGTPFLLSPRQTIQSFKLSHSGFFSVCLHFYQQGRRLSRIMLMPLPGPRPPAGPRQAQHHPLLVEIVKQKSRMSARLLVAIVFMGCALPAWGFVSSGLRSVNIMNYRERSYASAFRQRNTLPFAGRPLSQKAVHLRMSDDSTTVKEQCDGPAKEGEIGNVDVSAAKFGTDDIPTDGVIQLSENAKKQLTQLRKARGDAELVLRVGVRSGGCRSIYFHQLNTPLYKLGHALERPPPCCSWPPFQRSINYV